MSIFGSATRCYLSYDEEYISYEVYKSDHPWVLDRVWEIMMERKYFQLGTDCAELWDAEAAIFSTADSYLVRRGNAVLIFNGPKNSDLTKNQCDVICAALDVG